MATFIVRVQLSVGTDRNYTLLRDKLIKVGFTKKIVSKEGIAYILPNGNYLGDSDKTLNEILTIVRKITATVDKNPFILVTEAKQKGNAWFNLPTA